MKQSLCRLILTLSFVAVSSTLFAQTIDNHDKQEIRRKARILVEDYEYLLNYLSNSVYRPNVKTDRIVGSYSDNKGFKKIFMDSSIIVEDDLHPQTDRKFEKDVTIHKYLHDFSFRYTRSVDRGVDFDSINVSQVLKKDFVYVNVDLICYFRNKDNANPKLAYLPTRRRIIIRAEFDKESDKWIPYIAGISFAENENFNSPIATNILPIQNTNPPKVIKADVLIASGVGIGLLIAGSSIAGKAKSNTDYITYTENTNPNDPIWQNLGYSSRDDVYNTQNKKFNTGQTLKIIGGVAIISAGILIIRHLSKRKKNHFSVSRMEAIPTFAYSTKYNSVVPMQVGFGMKF